MEFVSIKLPDTLSVNCIFTVYHLELSPSKSGCEDVHDFPEIIYIQEGKNTVYIDDSPYEIKAGEMIIYAPGSRHHIPKYNDSTAYIISFSVEWKHLPRLYNKVIRLEKTEKLLISKIVEEGVKSFKKPLDINTRGMVQKDDVSEFELQEIKKQIELFLLNVYKSVTNQKESIKNSVSKNVSREDFSAAVNFLKEHLHEMLTLSQIAEGCSVSISKLKAVFKENCDSSPINYFIDLKLKEAKRLIKESTLNFTEIAELLGFNSLHYFSRLFKERVGMTPSEYARSVSQ